MAKKEQLPAIRFRGFADPWEQRKVGELSKRVIVGLATSVTPYYRQEGIPILRNLNIKENYLDDTDILFLERAYAESQVSKQIHTGDVLTVHTGYIGTSCIVPAKYDNCLTFTTLITTTDDSILHGEFLAQYLNSEIGMGAVQAVTTQGGRQNLNTNDFVKVEIRYPSLAEQEAICGMLHNIDTLITLHQRKHDKLVAIKRSMLEKMFPREGSRFPEIRFAGFTDPWEQRKVSDLFRITRGYVLAAPLTSESKSEDKPYPVYSSQTKDNGLMGYYKDYLYENAITWTTDGANAGTVNYRAGKFYCTNVCGVLLADKAAPNQMIAEALNNVAKGHVSYVGNPKLMNNVMAEIVISLPASEEERQRISFFFDQLDTLITLHQRKLEKLQAIKRSMLEKMFV